jgi:hypothetical protein
VIGDHPAAETAVGPAAGAQLGAPAPEPSAVSAGGLPTQADRSAAGIDLAQRREALAARFAELQCDLGGLAYEMAIRNHVRVDVLVRRAAILQDVEAELGEVERLLQVEETGTAGLCGSCGAPHSSGAVYCWQCGQPLLDHVASHTIGA